MKRKQILAVLLIITNLIVYCTPAGMVKVQAGDDISENNRVEVQQSEVSENSDTNDTENTDSAENNTEDSSDTDKTEADKNSVDDTDVDNTAQDVSGEDKDSTAENTSEKTDENATADDENGSADTTQEEAQDAVQIVAANGQYLKLGELKGYDSSDNTFTAGESDGDLRLLSHCDPAEIQKITIKLSSTGQIDITTPITANVTLEDGTKAEGTYDFIGIGSEEYPFEGTITGAEIPVYVNHTFFGGISSNAIFEKALSIVWFGDGTMPMIADIYQFDSESAEGHTLPVKVTAIKRNNTATAIMGSLFGTVKENVPFTNHQTLNLDSSVVDYTNAKEVSALSENGNAGLICNTLKSGTICLNGYNFPAESVTVQSTADYNSTDANGADSSSLSGNAGGLIGSMGTDATLDIQSTANLDKTTFTVTSTNGNAGGLIGLMQKGAKIVTGDDATVTLEKPTVAGGMAAGGGAGLVTDVIFADGELKSKININAPIVKSTGDNAATIGGFAGKYILNAENLGDAGADSKFPDNIIITTPALTVSNNGFAGGYFGEVNLNGTLKYTIGGADESTKKEIKPVYDSCSAEAIGAVAGKVTSNTIASTLLLKNIAVNATNNSDTAIQYHGGLVGELGTKSDSSDAAYLKADNLEISVKSPYSKDEEQAGFGGVSGLLAQGSIVQTENNIVITTLDGTAINRGGGLTGYAEKSVINLAGTTNLSGTGFANGTGKDAKTGWIVGRQDSALIYANGDGNGNGWTYVRGKENGTSKQAMNDIGNYGQIIRLNSGESITSKLSTKLIEIDENHDIKYNPKTEVTVSGNEITLGSEDAFALLSIAWNSRGYFGGITEIGSNNYSANNPKTKNITLSADINLTGSGITGLTRDTYTDDGNDTYAGEFNGGGKTLTLSIGETFGYKQDDTATLAKDGDDGYGEVISAGARYHGRQGLFAKVSTTTIQNLTIDGKINVSNAGQDILTGCIAGEIEGNSTSGVYGVTIKANIIADCENNQLLMVGGFYGGGYDDNTKLELGTLNDASTLDKAEATITIEHCTSNVAGEKINAGGIVGEIGEKSFELTANALQVGGLITTDVVNRAYVGGLIGIIKGHYEDTAEKHKINIKGATFDGFKIDASLAQEVCGGLFGSIWVNTGVYFTGNENNEAVDIKDAEIHASKAEFVGGLAYRSSGKWEIQDHGINFEKMQIDAGKDVGLLVCRGEQATDKIAGGTGSRQIGAIYLSTTNWDTSYVIPENGVAITTTAGSGIFDEFVAYTTPEVTNIVNNEVNGVISIATKVEGNKRVGVDTSSCTTYQNRTTYGKAHGTNAWSRYYYDLDQCQQDMASGDETSSNNNGKLDTPQELLLWSVYQYACPNIQSLFSKVTVGNQTINISDIKTSSQNGEGPWIIGDTAEDKSLNMEKYSYYPIKFDNGSVTIQNTQIRFNNEVIENTESGADDKKITQGTSENHTQHYTMHCGLFLTYQSANGTLTLNKVKFSGCVGKINNATSGALISDYATGYIGADNAIKYITINMTDIVLDGLKINDCGEGYAPLFINNIGNFSDTSGYGYATLSVNGINIEEDSYSMGTPVASSLIGTVGSEAARQVNLTFQGIVLPDKRVDGTNNGGIFSHATLLEQYAYNKDDNASEATYNFYSTEDWDGTNHKHEVTYGREITGTTEFTDLQKWYYDEATNGIEGVGLVYDDVNNKTGFDAKDYLPYVCKAYDKDNCMHEIKVNQRVRNITNGCGTYGHPYRITTEQELNILSAYMAGSDPRREWVVKITKSQDSNHSANSDTDYTSAQDVTYQYNGDGFWVQVENKSTVSDKEDWQEVAGSIKLGKDFMRSYLLNAYYDLRGAIVQGRDTNKNELILSNFKGFGSESYPFRGVITSTNDTTVVLQGEETENGLVPYSYGSVVKDLTISYELSEEGKGKTLTYEENTNTYYPKACFGGVIGCVLGGDNIIDNVTVKMANNWLTLSGDKKYLLQVGGYIGSVCGGGVIFRSITDKKGLTKEKITNQISLTESSVTVNSLEDILSSDNGLTANALSESEDAGIVGETSYSSLYVNPYVGRVLDGFAFYEANSKKDTLENTDKNYKINTIDTTDTGCLNINGNALTVKDAQGLLLLSAIVNSGAASNGIKDSTSSVGGASNAYSRMGNGDEQPIRYTTSDNATTYLFAGRYGKVRNALYNEIGTTGSDVEVANSEDKNLPGEGNLPYLIQKYCGNNAGIFGISTNSNIEINLSSTGSFDMADYGNGYQGIAARYVSSAVRGHVGDNLVNHPEGVVPEVKAFNGNNRTVTMKMQVREYVDDDFHAASVGGIFNVLRVAQGGDVSNLTIDENKEKITPVISLEYYNQNGEKAEAVWTSRVDVGAGSVAGSLVGYTGSAGNRDITLDTISVNNTTVTSSANSGGSVGTVGKLTANTNNKSNISDMSVLLQPKNSQIIYGITFNNCNYADLEITGKYAAGGFAAYLGGCDTQNPLTAVKGRKKTDINITGEDSKIKATDGSSTAGGLFGYVKTRLFINMTDEGTMYTEDETVLENVEVTARKAVGGYIGQIDERTYGINNVAVKGHENLIIVQELNNTGVFYAGGIIGYAKGSVQGWGSWSYAGWISNCSIENLQVNDEKSTGHDYSGTGGIKTNYIAGGVIGQVAGGTTGVNNGTINSAKVYGSVASGIVGQTDSELKFVKCSTLGIGENANTEIKGFSTAGGILGFWTGGKAVTIQNSKIQYTDIEGKDWGVGAFIGDADGGGVGTLYLFDSSAEDSKVKSSGNDNDGGGRWPCAGSVIGNLRNTIKASNVLVSDMTIDAKRGVYSAASKGLLFGSVTSDGIAVNIAGLSIQNIPDSNSSDKLAGGGNVTTSNDYIAFADYSGAATDTSDTSLAGSDTKNLLGCDNDTGTGVKTDVTSPYVVTSPKSTLALYEKEGDTQPKYLYSDGASWTSSESEGKISFTVKAKEIMDNKSGVKDGHYAYSNITNSGENSVNSFDFESLISTYNDNQPEDEKDSNETKHQAGTNFPVLQVANGNADAIKDYLNILTNGGFSAANSLNTKNDIHVTASAETYTYTGDKFVKAVNTDGTAVTPSFRPYTDSATGKLTFATTTDYDNGKDQFTLLTVTFKEKDAQNKEHNYNVHIPILVRRMLEMDFTATLTYGTDFKSSDYSNLSTHVLESFGSSITGLLTYTYNSAEGQYTDYGWQSYINAGGNLSEMKKSVQFNGTTTSLPAGTQLTLIDAESKRAYYYTAKGSADDSTGVEKYENGGINIPLTSFKDSDGTPYQEPSISELLKVTATKESNGLFVKVNVDGRPDNADNSKQYPEATIRIKNAETQQYEYYRLADTSLNEKGEYSIKVDEEKLRSTTDNTKSAVKENYYLVITVPESDKDIMMNGSIQTTVTSKIPHQIHYQKLVSDEKNGTTDIHENTASTYNLSNGYQQVLSETGNDGASKKISMTNSQMKVDVTDKITFPTEQLYKDYDELYLKFVGGLEKTEGSKTSGSSASSSAEMFPSGTTGEVEFYVYTKDSNNQLTYYVYNQTNKAWEESTDGKQTAVGYTWTSDGGNMELPLSTDGTDDKNALISLQTLREKIKEKVKVGNADFYVQVQMEANLPPAGLDVIPESAVEADGYPSDYVKLAYYSQLSTVSQGLKYSSNRSTAQGNTAYYREEAGGVKLTYDADQIDQLGINLLDLRYLDASNENAQIDTTATYDLSSMKKLAETLKNSNGIRFTLTLCPKDTGSSTESYDTVLKDAKNYMSVELKSENSGTVEEKDGVWSWTVPKETYYVNNGLNTEGVFDGNKLIQLIRLKVNVTNVENEEMQHFYSNYKVILRAEILNNEGASVIEGTSDTDSIIYTLTKIKTEFVE